MKERDITFSFGKNWNDYVDRASDDDLAGAMRDIVEWLGRDAVVDKRVIDVGSGSGIHSWAFQKLGARFVHSFDYDPYSVEATKRLREQAGEPENWVVEQGSVLDSQYVHQLGTFDVVYSWGVLHHTGAMWNAIHNCGNLVKPGGLFWIALYAKGPRYERDLALKTRFNAASPLGKRWMVSRRVFRIMFRRMRHGQNPLAWNRKVGRGMNVYNDIVDWLGGLPYETASEDEVVRYLRKREFVLEGIRVAPEGGCSKYVFSLPTGAPGIGRN